MVNFYLCTGNRSCFQKKKRYCRWWLKDNFRLFKVPRPFDTKKLNYSEWLWWVFFQWFFHNLLHIPKLFRPRSDKWEPQCTVVFVYARIHNGWVILVSDRISLYYNKSTIIIGELKKLVVIETYFLFESLDCIFVIKWIFVIILLLRRFRSDHFSNFIIKTVLSKFNLMDKLNSKDYSEKLHNSKNISLVFRKTTKIKIRNDFYRFLKW